jgi:hypothetical protein
VPDNDKIRKKLNVDEWTNRAHGIKRMAGL